MHNINPLLRRMITTVIFGYLGLSLAVILLAALNAAVGWYYGIGIFATGVITYRILVPALGTPSDRLRATRRRRDARRLPGPIH
jgi:hypothetical protein